MDTAELDHVPWFDPTRYMARNRDVRESGVDAYKHWLEYGREEERRGQRPSWFAPRFAETSYREVYPDVAAAIDGGAFASAAEHWAAFGREEVRRGDRLVPQSFDEAGYLNRRMDVAEAVSQGLYISGYDHWLQWGAAEEAGQGETRTVLEEAPAYVPIEGFTADIAEEKAAFWAKNGYLILEGAIDHSLCDKLNGRIERLWTERRTSAPPISVDVYLERPDSVRIPMREAPGDARAIPYKINDMFLVDDDARALALHPDVTAVLRWVLRDEPSLIGSLNFERGSTQKFHTDTLYMPGKTAGGMTAAWFALEDVTDEAGPLLYYPGSHEIPLFRFSSGDSLQINQEVPNYDDYMSAQVAVRGLNWQRFLPKKGDVLIWHEKLYHGGAPIKDLAQTRKSLVAHYWRAAEMNWNELIAWGAGYYWNRAPLA